MKKVIGVLSLGVLLGSQALACCVAAPFSASAKIGDQNNIIVWNPDTKTETFIRYASFESNAKDLGFIAPSPTMPKLDIVDKSAYDTLYRLEPKEDKAAGIHSADAANMPKSAVEVLQTVNVGKYEATSLKASDSNALAAYLKKNGYAMTPGIEKWTKVYVAKDWVLTAFKVRKDANNGHEQEAISMTFSAETPFNPYYVPAENVGSAGNLRLFFISTGKYKAGVGEKGSSWDYSKWESDVPEYQHAVIESGLKVKLPKNPFIAYYEAPFPVADQDDLFFAPSGGSKALIPAFVAIFCSLIAVFASLFAAITAKKKQQVEANPQS